MINEQDAVPRRFITLIGASISVGELGTGPTVAFVPGSVAYSYCWRNIIPHLAAAGFRCIAPDLRGMGESEREDPSGPGSYTFSSQRTMLESLIETVAPSGRLVLVGHELGATLALEVARRLGPRVAGVAIIEGAFRITNDSLFDDDVHRLLEEILSEAGEEKVLLGNSLIEEFLPKLTMRRLTEVEMSNYRSPYRKPGETRRAMLSMIRQLPTQSNPGPLGPLAEELRLWCAQSRIPKLVIGGSPGFLVPPAVLGTASRWAAATVASVPGLHFLMEDSPARITARLLGWLEEIGHG